MFADSKTELQTSLNVLYTYYNTFYYNNLEIEIVNKFTYVGIVFSTGGSFSRAQLTSSGQALRGIFKLNKQLNKFTNLTVKHRIDLYDKLIYPMLSYCSEVWGFLEGTQIERVHM